MTSDESATIIALRDRGAYGGAVKAMNDVSSFGQTREEAVGALREAVELYFEDAPLEDFTLVAEAEIGQELIHA